ncbi:hypothetical protein OMK64_02690 [Cellulomonas fimi]|uniref:hypothetical protein n=1 Tax=Cellulomonas fimi TaxID=1708 RepID=UPI00234C4341|nr:hypothetical protein [Cellulomonas fimi]MDC7120437.1 hypothetical protein [Cellulomonas fimi]
MLPRPRVAVLVATALALVVVPAVPSAAAGPVTAITMQADPGTWTYERMNAVFDSGLTVEVREAATRDNVTVRTDPARTPDGLVQIQASPGAPRLAVGSYAIGGPFDATLPYVMTWFGPDTCMGGTGTLDVLALTRDASVALTSLAADVTRSACPAPASSGHWSLRWNSTVPYQHTATTSLDVGELVGGRSVDGTVTVTNAGTGSQTYGASEIPVGNPEYAGIATVVSDGCAGRTLAPRQNCTLTVRFVSDGEHHFRGYVRTPDQTARGVTLTRVQMEALPVPPVPVVVPRALRGEIQLTSSTQAQKFRVLRASAGEPEHEVAHDVAMPWTDTAVTGGVRYTYRVRAVNGDVASEPSPPLTVMALLPAEGNDGELVPIDPVRVLDTRSGLGAPAGKLGAGKVLTFDPALGDAIPRTGVSAVLLNVTGTEPTQATHVRVWPAGDPLPDTSSLNLVPGQSRPNQVVVPLGDDGRVALHNNAGATHLLVDVQGFYSTADGEDGGGYHPVATTRILDTREPDWDGGVYPLGPGEEIWVPVDDLLGRSPTAVDVNLTVTQPTQAGHVVAWAGDTDAPGVSNVNYAPGQTVPNHAVVPVSFDGAWPGFALRNNTTGTAHVLVDLQGWYDDGTATDGLRFRPSTTTRVADTRAGGRAVAAGQTLVVPSSALPAAVAHVVNATATQSSGPGHLVAWSGDGSVPGTSVVNFARGEDSPNLATVATGADGRIAVTAGSSSVHVIVDHLGVFY